MTLLSPLQLLPERLVQDIVRYVTSTSRLQFEGINHNPRDCGELLLPLLCVCHNFREVVYSHFCRQYRLDQVDKQKSGFSTWPKGPRRIEDLGNNALGLTRELVIYLDLHSVYTGKALEELVRHLSDDPMFPRVRRLTFIMSWLADERQVDSAETSMEDNIGAFVQRVRQIAPSVNLIDVQPGVDSVGVQRVAHFFGNVISQLSQLTRRISFFSVATRIPMELPVDTVHDLVHFNYYTLDDNIDNHVRAMQVARQSAATLQYLRFNANTRTGLSNLFWDSDSGSYFNYPCLLSLVLGIWTFSPVLLPPVARGVVLFPRLSDLKMTNTYPFSDDLPFRGNVATLRYLHIVATREVCDILRQYEVFSSTSHSELKRVEIESPTDGIPSHFESREAYMRFALGIGPGALVRSIRGISTGEDLSPALSLLTSHSCIQLLDFPDTPLMLWDIEFLTRSLPLLSNLGCLSTGLGLMMEDIALDEYAEFMHSLSSPSRENFRCWRLANVVRGDLQETVECVLSVALFCPNFDYAAVSSLIRKEFMKLMEETIQSDGFKQHAPRLRRLLFD
ncbi:hypothetical protein GGH92_001487 [Coemansia sp. RSA 2673]|nr:hypothetical protein GGH92_001487 [Coemansia sp. RSA 2673]